MSSTPLLPNSRIVNTSGIHCLYPHVNYANDIMSEPIPPPVSCNENLGPMLLAVSYVLLCTAITAVVLRLYVKLGLQNGIRSDDYTIVASLVSHNRPEQLLGLH